MASVNDGIAVLSFGTTTITGYIVESVGEATTGESIQIPDEDGQIIVDIHSFMVQTSTDLTVVPKDAVSAPEIGDVFAYVSETHGSQKITVKEITVTSVNKDVTRWAIKGDRFPDIALT